MRIAISVAGIDGKAASDAQQIADMLEQCGHEVHLLHAPRASDEHAGDHRATSVPRTLWAELRSLMQLFQLLWARRIQVLYRYASTETWRERIVARLARVPIVSSAAALQPLRNDGPELESSSTSVVAHLRALEYRLRSAYVHHARHEIPILCYHRLVSGNAECGLFATHVNAALFEQHLRYLRDGGYRTLHFSDLDTTQTFDRTSRAVILTFDDGYEDNYRLLFPLLKRYDAKAVIYLVSGCAENTWDAARGERPLNLLTDSQCAEMLASGLVEFGAHSVTHPDLSTMTAAEACREISESKSVLQARLGVGVQTFAYPYGRLNADVKMIVKQAGYRFGVATHSGPLALHEDPFQIRRIVIFPRTSLRRFKRKVSGQYSFYRAARARAD